MGTYEDRGEGRGAVNGEASLLEAAEVVEMHERLAALEWTLESMDWRLLTTQADQEFSRPGLATITELSRIMAIKNPLIKRGVAVQRLYVFGQGFNVRAEDAALDDALTAFYEDPKNATELSQQEMSAKEIELQVTGQSAKIGRTTRVSYKSRLPIALAGSMPPMQNTYRQETSGSNKTPLSARPPSSQHLNQIHHQQRARYCQRRHEQSPLPAI